MTTLITIWLFLFVSAGIRLAMEVWTAEWNLERERRAWATMIHNRKLNNRLFVERLKINTLYRRGEL